jgi:16S rRNA (uracil1498-N3)-methyltransferase
MRYFPMVCPRKNTAGLYRPKIARRSHNRDVHSRFYAPGAHRSGDVVELPADEAQHLTKVLRLTTGAAVVVFNGRGGEFDAIVEQTGKHAARVRVEGARAAAPEPRVALTLAQAVLKGDKMDAVVRDAVMMGVAAIQPVVTARSEVALASLVRGGRQERWQRIAVSSAKQCGRAVVPIVHPPRTFGDVAASLGDMTLPGPGVRFVEPSASTETIAVGDLDDTPPRETTVVVGPEGGWTPEELARGLAVARPVTIGRRTLRADAMPIVGIAALLARWREL